MLFRYVVGPIGNFWSSVHFFTKNTIAQWGLYLTVFMVLEKAMGIVNWKIVLGMDDQFFAAFAVVLTFCISAAFNACFFVVGGLHNISHAVFSGDCSPLFKDNFLESSHL